MSSMLNEEIVIYCFYNRLIVRDRMSSSDKIEICEFE